ncbi:MAG TPA: hypothetical protein VF746_31405 [Longimicrobium sp.]|jgi:alpha-tubulin suppressor-like RCC1 family protein
MRPPILRTAPLLLVGAALFAACTERLPSDASLEPGGPLLTVATNPFVTMDGGLTHACGLTSAGQAWCWGRNATAQLGDNSAAPTTVPVAVHHPSGVTFTQVSAGDSHTCAITSAGQAYCWGYNADSRLGDSTTSMGLTPRAVLPVGAIAFTSISAGGGQHTCGLNGSGQAYCWGYNFYGQIGDSTTTFAMSPVAVHQPAGVTFTSIYAGQKHTCALTSGGQAYCWGYGGDGAMGHNALLGEPIPTAVQQPAGVTFASITTEYNHTCGVTSGGQAYCWGLNSNAQLGDSTVTKRLVPTAVKQPAGVTFASITTGTAHTCALTSAGQEYCWGVNTRGQLGNGTFANKRTPTAVSHPAGVTFASVHNGGIHSCALDGGGQAWCWGRNDYSQLGNNSTTDSATPVAVQH